MFSQFIGNCTCLKTAKLLTWFAAAFLSVAASSSEVLSAEHFLTDSGMASIYSLNGLRTASGEIANSDHFTAAHRSLPFGTMVRVTNLRNGQSVVVRINDRGPFMKGRIIDVTTVAAHSLGFTGLTQVNLAILGGSALTPPARAAAEVD